MQFRGNVALGACMDLREVTATLVLAIMLSTAEAARQRPHIRHHSARKPAAQAPASSSSLQPFDSLLYEDEAAASPQNPHEI